jgi:hypothetical protein
MFIMVLWCCTDRGVHAILSLVSVSSYAKLVLYLLYTHMQLVDFLLMFLLSQEAKYYKRLGYPPLTIV